MRIAKYVPSLMVALVVMISIPMMSHRPEPLDSDASGESTDSVAPDDTTRIPDSLLPGDTTQLDTTQTELPPLPVDTTEIEPGPNPVDTTEIEPGPNPVDTTQIEPPIENVDTAFHSVKIIGRDSVLYHLTLESKMKIRFGLDSIRVNCPLYSLSFPTRSLANIEFLKDSGTFVIPVLPPEEPDPDPIEPPDTIITERPEFYPLGTGEWLSPFNTPASLALNDFTSEIWISGIIVGSFTGDNVHDNAMLLADTLHCGENILLSVWSEENNPDYCVPVVLAPDTEPYHALNLVDNPQNYGQLVSVKGDYDDVAERMGLTNVSQYNFDSKGAIPDGVMAPGEEVYPVDVSIYSLDGNLLHRYKLRKGENIPLDNFKEGIYIIRSLGKSDKIIIGGR